MRGKSFLRRKACLLLLFLSATLTVYAQSAGELNFNVSTDSLSRMNIISFYIKTSQVPLVHRQLKLGDKLEFRDLPIIVNDHHSTAGKIKVRGQTSLGYRRKSYSLKTEEKLPFYKQGGLFKVKKFYAVSLSMDKDYIRNAISCEVLSLFNLRIPDHCYATININDSSEGIYMVFYPPPDYVMDCCQVPFVLRRGYRETIKKTYANDLSHKEIKVFKKEYLTIYNPVIRKFHGRQLYDQLSGKIDLTGYFDWLAFNYLFKNGDYTDEVYFYHDPAENRLKIIPWDFDDLFMETPHEGKQLHSKDLQDKLLFSFEDKLDQAIARDPYLYNEYLKEFDHFLEVFTTARFKTILEDIYSQVLPYYMNRDIIEQSYYDKYRLTNIGRLRSDLRNIYGKISAEREKLLQTVSRQIGENNR